MLDVLLAHLRTARCDPVIQMAESLDPERRLPDAGYRQAQGRLGRPGQGVGAACTGITDRRGAGSGRAVGGRDHAGIVLRLSRELAVTIDVRFPADFVCLTPDSRPTGCTGCWSAVDPGCVKTRFML